MSVSSTGSTQTGCNGPGTLRRSTDIKVDARQHRGFAVLRRTDSPEVHHWQVALGADVEGLMWVFRTHRHDAIAHDPRVRAAAGAKDGNPFKWLFLEEPGKP